MSFEDQQKMTSAEAKAQTLLLEEFGPNFRNYRSIVIPKLPGYSAIIITFNQCQFKMYTFGSIELEVETQIIKFNRRKAFKAHRALQFNKCQDSLNSSHYPSSTPVWAHYIDKQFSAGYLKQSIIIKQNVG